jgi:hypothetical protein
MHAIFRFADANLPNVILKHAVSDFQLNDLFEKAKALFAKANLTFANRDSKDTRRTKTPKIEKPPKTVRLKKTPPKKRSAKKTVSNKPPSKKKTKRRSKRGTGEGRRRGS